MPTQGGVRRRTDRDEPVGADGQNSDGGGLDTEETADIQYVVTAYFYLDSYHTLCLFREYGSSKSIIIRGRKSI